MIEVEKLVKTFAGRKVLDGVSFTARNGRVTGFLGPNGAGKSTTMKALLNLIHPDSGRSFIDGRPFTTLSSPMRSVGAVLDARSAHKGMKAETYLRSLALTNGIPKSRVDEVMAITGIGKVASRRAGTFSLGMSQRLAIAAALLGDPHNLVLDEPINGLDPEGVKWVRDLCRYYASQGRTVLLSSHLMSEVAITADDLVIIGRGRILTQTTVERFVGEHSRHDVRVVTPDPDRLRQVFAAARGITITPDDRREGDPERSWAVRIAGAPLEAIAGIIAHHQLVVYQLVQERGSLEDAYMELTRTAGEYHTRAPGIEAGPREPNGIGRNGRGSDGHGLNGTGLDRNGLNGTGSNRNGPHRNGPNRGGETR
ncbi:ATP-binding cassette domain-containing protein [Bifidobacterium simiarum]|uniref:ATP-binding cassette domain-containing protein n=1 Tax=Bifidobacterium simiarum TaxID=2045441 RepID=UPI001BDD490D|nr:ATP-binding cassette domain-containing protein [Bifidobacterium simiarum]MBT1165519.1 ATP-binding cassette domain-containing protein [Bifidobacterium simiarum]